MDRRARWDAWHDQNNGQDTPASQLVAYTRQESIEGLSIVEIGCGTGASALYLAQHGAALVVGVDISRVAIEKATKRGEGVPNLRFVEADALYTSAVDLGCPEGFDAALDCRGFQMLWAVDADLAATALARLVKKGGVVVTVAGNANEFRNEGTSLTCAELVGSLCAPTFSLVSLVETRFDAGGDDELAPLAWRAVFTRTHDDALLGGQKSARARVSAHRASTAQDSPTSSASRKLVRKSNRRTEPPVIARKLTSFALDDDSGGNNSTTNMDDAVDAALSVDGSVAPSDCGSESTHYTQGDGFENIAASRAAAARAERARQEGDVPWVRWWDRRSQAYDLLLASQPVLGRLARRVATNALHWAFNSDSMLGDDDRLVAPSKQDHDRHDDEVVVRAVDLAAGSGVCTWALADVVADKAVVRADLVEPSHSMAALARARACKPGLSATVWQIPAERSHDRLPARLAGSVDLVACSSGMDYLNYHDVFEVAAALLRPGGALAFDLGPECYEATANDDLACSWVPAVRAALDARGLLDLLDPDHVDAIIARVKSKPPLRPPCSASNIAAAAAAAGLRLAKCDIAKDHVAGDFFVAHRAMSTSWLAEPFAGMPPEDAKHLRSVVLLDAASRAARNAITLRTALFVLVKPASRIDATLAKLYKSAAADASVAAPAADDGDLYEAQPSGRPIAQAVVDDHFGWPSAKV